MLDGEQKDLRSQLQTSELELSELRQTHSLEVDSAKGWQEEMGRKVCGETDRSGLVVLKR